MPSRWAHRTTHKRTAVVRFTQGRLAKGAANAGARALLEELTRSRGDFCEKLTSFAQRPDVVDSSLKDYLSVVRGLAEGIVHPPGSTKSASAGSTGPAAATPDAAPSVPPAEGEGAAAEGAAPEAAEAAAAAAPAPAAASGAPPQKSEVMRTATMFRWTDVTSGKQSDMLDAQFDLTVAILNTAMWYMGHASSLGITPSHEDEDIAKEIYRSLQSAAGLFEHVLEVQLRRTPFYPNSDMDERLIRTQLAQVLAEGEEITLERARMKSHKPDLIASIARDLHDRFLAGGKGLEGVVGPHIEEYQRYFDFKSKFYKAYALCYQGLAVFAKDECGNALKYYAQCRAALGESQESAKVYASAGTKRMSYHTTLGFNPTNTPIYASLIKTLNAAEDKAKRENGFIYHHKLPTEDLDLPIGKSLVKALPFVLPELSALWATAEFDVKKIPRKGQDVSADRASSDETPVGSKAPGDIKPKRKDEMYCVVS